MAGSLRVMAGGTLGGAVSSAFITWGFPVGAEDPVVGDGTGAEVHALKRTAMKKALRAGSMLRFILPPSCLNWVVVRLLDDSTKDFWLFLLYLSVATPVMRRIPLCDSFHSTFV